MAAVLERPTKRRPMTRRESGQRGQDPVRFPAAVVIDVIGEAVEADGLLNFASRAGVPERSIYRIVAGHQQTVGLGLVDDLVTRGLGDPGLFHSHPGLAAIYEGTS